jgi:prolyl oligopeptidase
LSPTRDSYHGVAVDDPYRWLENWADPAVRAWSDKQSACARQYLDALQDAPKIRARLTQILTVERGTTYSGPKYKGGRLFVLRKLPRSEQTSLVWFAQADTSGPVTIVLDPMQLDPTGDTSIDWYVPSEDGQLVAVSLSSGGSEGGTLRIFDATRGKPIDDLPIESVSKATASGDVAWSADGRGFFYTRYPHASERPERELSFYQQVYYHKIGTDPATDRYELGKELPSIAAIRLSAQPSTGRIVATVQNGDSGQFRFFLREPDGRWRALGGFGDGHVEVAFGAGDDLFLVTKAGAPRGKVLRLSAKDLDINRAQTVIPESDIALAHSAYEDDPPTITVTEGALFVLYQTGGPTQLRAFALDGKPRPDPTQAPLSQVSSVNALGGDEVLFGVESFVAPEHWVRYDARTGVTQTLQSVVAGSRPWSDVTVERDFAVSRDGTRVPVTILRMRGVKTRGLLLNGYGGFNIARLPSFAPQFRVLLEQGVVYAAANLRGGSEFGEEWHRQGSRELKQNVFDDFIAVAQHLLDKGYAPPGKLAITGTSNGGLLMGAVVTQRPQLAQAVISKVGIYDSLRTELDANGAFNIPEYGTVKDERMFLAIRAYSPYHNARNGERYPPTLLLTGANDNRVNPMHSRKMIARLQAAERDKRVPLLLRTSANTGHGAGTPTSAQIEELTDIYSFILKSLDIPYRQAISTEATAAAAQITAEYLRDQIATFSSDEFEGRAAATPGDKKARAYLIEQLKQLGLQPGGPDGGWQQPFDVVGVTAHMPKQWSFRKGGKSVSFKWSDQFIATSGVQSDAGSIRNAEVVFVGYGIQAPEYGWDDFKGQDLTGKVLLMLNNDPDWDPTLFAGKTRLYYGRWIYKYESAARHGAAGAIIIHTTPSAGYPFQVAQSSWSGEQIELPAEGEPHLQARGWLTESASRELLKLGGQDLDKLVAAAKSREFQPVPLGVTTSLAFKNTLNRASTANVYGVLKGSDSLLSQEYVIYSAHFDHLGVGKADARGDKIYNGAMDNATGVAQLLAIGKAYRALPQPPRRSIMLLFAGAEEQGMLGSRFYATHPTIAPGNIATNVNYDGGNRWGRTRDIIYIGKGRSTLDPYVEAIARTQGRVVTADQFPDRGFFYRSDQFNFAKVGVPALYLATGTDFIGQPPGWGEQQLEQYEAKNYHQPSDQIDGSWNFDGMIEDAQLGFHVGCNVANADEMPGWVAGDEFEAARKAALAARRALESRE